MAQFINQFLRTAILKALLISLVFCTPYLVHSQDTIAHRFEFSVAAGPGYNFIWGKESPNTTPHWGHLNTYKFPKIIGVFEASILYRFKGDRHIGFTYSELNYTNTLSNSKYFGPLNLVTILENFKNYHSYQYFGLDFRQEFIPRFHFGVGICFYVHHFNILEINYYEEPGITAFIAADLKQRLDDLALSASIDYYFPVNNYFQIGIRTKGFLSLSGFEALTLTPVVKFSF